MVALCTAPPQGAGGGKWGGGDHERRAERERDPHPYPLVEGNRMGKGRHSKRLLISDEVHPV